MKSFKEYIEYINELSKDTLKSYTKKAAFDGINLASSGAKGIGRAVDKLSK